MGTNTRHALTVCLFSYAPSQSSHHLPTSFPTPPPLYSHSTTVPSQPSCHTPPLPLHSHPTTVPTSLATAMLITGRKTRASAPYPPSPPEPHPQHDLPSPHHRRHIASTPHPHQHTSHTHTHRTAHPPLHSTCTPISTANLTCNTKDPPIALTPKSR